MACLGLLEVFQGIVILGRLGQTGQHGRLGQIQVADMLAKVGLGRSLDPVGHVAKVDLVQVQLQDLVLAIVARESPGQHGLP